MSTTPTDPVIELLVGSTYVDITADVRLNSADSGGGIEITRGKPNEGNRAEPTQLNLTLNNGASKVPSTLGQPACYSPKNPNGPYYGLLGRNQKIRVGLSRWSDSFNRTAVVDGWGRVPDKTQLDGTVLPGPKWNITGSAANYDTTGTAATIQANANNQLVTFGTYGDVEIKAKMRVSDRTSEFGIVARLKSTIAPFALDGTFESGVAGWQVGSGTSTITSTSAQFHSGTKSALLTVAGSPVSVSFTYAPTYSIPVKVNGSYRLRFWARHATGGTVTRNLSWYDSNLVFVGSTSDTLVHAAGVWTLNEITATAPQDARFVRAGPLLAGSPVNGTLLFVDDYEFYDLTDLGWYTTYITPGGTDEIRVGKVTGATVQPSLPPTVRSVNGTLPANVLINTDYWMRTQMSGQRIRVKWWKDGDPEPLLWTWRYFDDATTSETPVPMTGEVGFIVNGGTALVTIDSVEINQWRAHAEIAELPPRWDLSRSDRWVNIQARGILRRLGQGRKSSKSALTTHLQSYAALSSGWWNLESDTGEQAGNQISGGLPANISGLTFSAPELTGPLAIPGIEGYATLSTDNAYFISSVPNHVNTGAETMLFGLKIPTATGSDVLIATFTSTGTARTWKIWNTALGGVRIDAINATGTVLSTDTVGLYNADIPQGSWIMATLFLSNTISPGNVTWAFNYHRPGSSLFFTGNGSFAGVCGNYSNIIFRGSPALTALGNLSITQVMHYAGDLPFVSYDFEKAANAYIGETAALRWLRLTANAGVAATTTGFSGVSEAMGAQLPAKLLDNLEDCAKVEDGIMMEERDDWSLTLVTRDSLWNRRAHTLDIDAGHLSAPLEPNNDDQGTRNDITVSRPNGGFARSIQEDGPLNVNPPEDDPDGVGVYDDTPQLSFAVDSQLQAAADFKRGKGTQDQARYSSMHADLTATVYQASSALAAATMAIDLGDVIEIDNPEVSPDPDEEQVSSYTEQIDQYDWDITWTAAPAAVFRVGVVGITTRVGSQSNITQAAFTSGTTTRLKTTLIDPAGYQWVTPVDTDASFPFDIDVSGVRLRVLATGDVLNSNPSFETGTNGWVPSSANAVLAPDTFNTIRGLQNMRITALAAGTDGAVQDPATPSITVAATDYLIVGWIKTEIGATAVRLAVDWYQADNTTFISTSLPTAIVTTANIWVYYTAVVTSPALGARARLRVQNVFAGATRMWVESLRIIPVSSYAADPQTLTVEQVPVNGIIKEIPIGSVVKLAAPWHIGW